MTPNELTKLNNLVENLNAKFNENKTLEGFIRFTKKINMVETVSFKQVKDEINLMFERLLEEQEENTW